MNECKEREREGESDFCSSSCSLEFVRSHSVHPDLISIQGGSALLFVDDSVLANFLSVCTSLIGSCRDLQPT